MYSSMVDQECIEEREEGACPQKNALPDSDTGWEETLRSEDDKRLILERISEVMAIADYGDEEIFGMCLALDEAIVNGLKHGNQGDPAKRVVVRYRIGGEQVLAEVEDEGEGFDPDEVPDPRAPEYLERPNGRGLLLMRCFTTWMRYNERGNSVTLCKRRSRVSPAEDAILCLPDDWDREVIDGSRVVRPVSEP